MHSQRSLYLSAACIALLSACAVGKDYQRPAVKTEAEWSALKQGNMETITLVEDAKVLEKPWWLLFEDATFTLLIEKAITNNNDLKAADARIKEARANERLADSAFFPQLDARGSVNRGTTGGFLGNKLDTTQQYGVNGRWEIDVFGGNRRRSEAAKAATEAAQADQREVRLRLISEVARNYVRLRATQQQYALTLRNLDLQKSSLEITEEQRSENVVSQFDVLRARAQTNSTKARLPQLKADAFAAIQRLTVLVADQSEAVKKQLEEIKIIPAIPKNVVGATPIATLAHRPDLQAAERRLAQSTALSAAAFAEFFPKLSLDGFFGASRSNMYGSLDPWSATTNALFPLFNFGRIQAGVDAADARQEQALYNFQQTLLLAIEDVEVSFSAYLNEQERQDTLKQLASEQGEAAKIASEQYMAGIAPQLDLLDAQRNALEAETQHVISQALTAQNLIRLYTALGDSGTTIAWPKAEMDAQVQSLPTAKNMVNCSDGNQFITRFCANLQ